jgi:RNA polymerase sigma factor (sigma-70 family)
MSSEYPNRSLPDRSHKDPASPPWCGPYAIPKWSGERGHWVRALNAEGARVVEDHILKYRDYKWGCGQIIATKFPRVARCLGSRIITGAIAREDITAAAEYGVLIAALRYDPSRGSFTSAAIWAIYQHVLTLLNDHSKSMKYNQEVESTDLAIMGIDCLRTSRDASPQEQLLLTERQALIHQSVEAAELTPEERQVFQSVVMESLTIAEAAEVHQMKESKLTTLLVAAMEKISYAAYGIIDYT